MNRISKNAAFLTLAAVIAAGLFVNGVIIKSGSALGSELASPILKDLGGPSEPDAVGEETAVGSGISAGSYLTEDFLGFIVVESGVLSPDNPLSNILPARNGLMVYRVKEGDTIYEIAANFGINIETIIWANPSLKPSLIRPGEEVVILPVSGVLHSVQSGETIESVAGIYGIDGEAIKKINPDFQRILENKNAPLIIPQGRPLTSRKYRELAAANLPNLGNYFILPTTGWNWGRLHGVNAVDIANICGTPVYAAAEGLVVEAGSPKSWNNGYGGFVKLEHPNGTHTLYAHLNLLAVSVGNYILQADKLGDMGRTGNTDGPTGCHLHFEVYGAKNPLAK